MKVPKAPKTKSLAETMDLPDVNPVADPKKLTKDFIGAGKALAENFTPIYTAIREVNESPEADRPRVEGKINPDWSFVTTGMENPTARQLGRLSEQAILNGRAYLVALEFAEKLLDETDLAIPLAKRFHHREREQQQILAHLELLDRWFEDFQKMEKERSNLLTLVVEYNRKLPVPLLARRADTYRVAVALVACAYDAEQITGQLRRLQGQIDQLKARRYAMNDEWRRQAELIKPLLGEGDTVRIPQLVWGEDGPIVEIIKE